MLEYDVRFARDNPKHLSVWYAFWGEAKGSTLYREVGFPRDQRYMKDVRALLQALVQEGGYDHIDLPALNKGIEAMLFGFWLDTHLYPGTDHYAIGMRALRTYLSALFPRHFAAA